MFSFRKSRLYKNKRLCIVDVRFFNACVHGSSYHDHSTSILQRRNTAFVLGAFLVYVIGEQFHMSTPAGHRK